VGERSRFSLPSLGIIPKQSGAPTVDDARTALGGRVATDAGAGACVHVAMKRGAAAIGVVVCVSGDERDVWIGDGRFVRARASDVSALAEVEPSLGAVAADAARFAALAEGERVAYVDRKQVERVGTLVEKCRYGALVSAEDAKIIAVSFRKLGPAAARAEPAADR
jgi:hypothetical protein